MGILGQPVPLGYGRAAKEAQAIAAPLLAAAALSLAGVVAGAGDDPFRWPGVTLLALVTSSLTLIASIQLNFHARQYFYSRQDIDDWYLPEYPANSDAYAQLCRWQHKDFRIWSRYNRWGAHCFNSGTLLLGLAVAMALIPPLDGRQPGWRWSAAVLVLLCTLADGLWTWHLYRTVGQLDEKRGKRLTEIVNKSGEQT